MADANGRTLCQGNHRTNETWANASSSLFGFLFGSVLAGSSVYTYLVSEYKISNDLLTEDIYVCCDSSRPCGQEA